MNLNILLLPALPHTVTYWATDSCALLWYMRRTLLRCIVPRYSYRNLPGDSHVFEGRGMSSMYAHPRRQIHEKNIHSSLNTF